jgi:uncharacterized membrane protein
VTLGALTLVLISACTHAWWNFVLKKSAGGEVFIGLSKLVEALVFLPLFVTVGARGVPLTSHSVLLVTVAAVGVGLNYIFLMLAYRHGDLSLIYPIQRGATLLFLPVFAWFAIGERIDVIGGAGLLAILAGVFAMQLRALERPALLDFAHHLKSPAVGYALIVALTNAIWALWDKYAVQSMAPFSYMYLYTAMVAAGYVSYIRRRHNGAAIATEWRARRWSIVQVGVFNMVSYSLVLFAFRSGTSSYIVGFRQLSIAVGVWLGWRLLNESLTPPRRLGTLLIIAGCLLVSFAR